jgi:hypothetical protein
VRLEARVKNLSDASVVGVDATVTITGGGRGTIETLTQPLAPLAPKAQITFPLTFPTGSTAPGEYLVTLALAASPNVLATCQTSFAVESTAVSGAGIGGTIAVDPGVVNAGDPTTATYTVQNHGNATVNDLPLTVLLVDPDSGQVMATLNDVATLGEATQTLASTTLLVINEPPDCARAQPSVASLWPPNHRLVPVAVNGVTDPDGDPVTITITQVLQDEPTNAAGDGNTCPDATGTGTGEVSVRSERAGGGDGRVYHLRFGASDGRGGTCQGEVRVCVPHDQGAGDVCVDQGPIYDSTACGGH